MLGRFPTVYHFHIPKCGGTSIAGWLSRHVGDRRPFDPAPLRDLEETFGATLSAEALRARERQQAPVRRQLFYAADLVHTHAPLRDFARDAAFAFTMVRDPVARVVSHVADWRRLAAHDLAPLPRQAAAMIAEAPRLRLAVFLDRYGRQFDILDNLMTRTLAGLSLDLAARRALSPPQLAQAAIENLENKLAYVGLAERPEASFARLADLLGLAPEPQPPRLNATGSSVGLAEEAAEAATALAELTACDRIVYDHAAKLFMARDAAAGEAYSRADFERQHAADAARQLQGHAVDGDIVFSVRDPFLGCGLHGRDGAGLETCCVWSGPSPAFVLYMPAPEGARLQLKLWVRGYADLAQRAALRVLVDGEPAAHRFTPAPGYAEALVIEARARRPFVALEVDVGATTTTGGGATYDSRRRGLAFDRYGWRALPD